jgi:hypothetical protein
VQPGEQVRIEARQVLATISDAFGYGQTNF